MLFVGYQERKADGRLVREGPLAAAAAQEAQQLAVWSPWGRSVSQKVEREYVDAVPRSRGRRLPAETS